MNLVSKLIYQKGFSELEKGIADYIINNKEKVFDMKLVDLAEATYTSTATISRFCKKLGEKDYNSFRINFMKDIMSDYNSEIDFNYPFKNNDSDHEMIYKIGELCKDAIEATKDLIEEDVFNKVVEELYNAPEIDVFAAETSYLSGLLFQYRMLTINRSIQINSPFMQKQSLITVNKKTVAIVISYNGDLPENKRIIKYKREHYTNNTTLAA